MYIRIPDGVVCRVVDGEAVILNLDSGIYFGLDSVGTRMWELLAEHGSTESAITPLLAAYDVEEKQLREDLDALARKLAEHGLVTIEAEATRASP
jgi:hypothetical protein